MARQWIGHKVTAASYHDQWLMEGLARYVGAMYVESTQGSTSQFRDVLEEARAAAMENDVAGAIWLGPRLTSSETPRGYRTVGGKGMWVIHMLRGEIGQDAFSRMLRELVQTHADRSMSTWDFKRLAEKHAGKEMDWFFDQWVFGTGIPAYSLDYKVESAQDGVVIEGAIKQSGVPDGFTMQVPVYADDELLGRVQVSDSEGEFRFKVAKRPERVVVDPQQTILATTVRGIP
jgi:aminopeptidase N